MLKKVLRKLVTLTVTVATVATMAAPVSAATLTPKKSHSKAEITEYVDYLNDITDSWTFRADGYVSAFSVSDEDDSDEEKFSAAVLLLLPVQDLICISQVCFTSKKWIPHLGWGIVNLVLRILMIMVINMIINGKYLNIIHLISAQMEHPN